VCYQLSETLLFLRIPPKGRPAIDRGLRRKCSLSSEALRACSTLYELRTLFDWELGVGVIVATQNPMDLDYRALSNAGLWCVGRLQTDADRERVVDGLGDTGPGAVMTKSDVANVIKKLVPRWFLLRDAHAREGMMLLQPRWAMTLMLGPMTRTEIKRARERQVLAKSSHLDNHRLRPCSGHQPSNIVSVVTHDSCALSFRQRDH
jgi:hypothetical protein